MLNHAIVLPEKVKTSGLIGLATFAALFLSLDASAAAFNTNISITATANLNGFSQAAPTGLTQSGTISSVIGGTTGSATVDSALNVTGTLAQGGALTDINDGVGISFSGSGNLTQVTTEASLFGDYSVKLDNTSLTDTFKIILGWEFTNRVDANGSDAFAQGEMFLNNGVSDIVFSKLVSDTLLGDQAGGSNDGTQWDTAFGPLNSFGASLLDNGTVLLEFILAPGQIVNLTGRNDMRGSANNGDYTATVSSRLFVNSVANQTVQPPTLPEPTSLWLLAAGVMGFHAARRFRAAS